jgi:hypothetical protein
MESEMRDRIDWVDKGLDGLREEIDGHFVSQKKELGELRREVENLTRRRPSLLTRLGYPSWAKAYKGTSWSCSPELPTGLGWTDGRIADLQSHVRQASTGASDDVAEIKARIEVFNKEKSNRRSNCLWLLFYSAIVLCIWITEWASALLS